MSEGKVKLQHIRTHMYTKMYKVVLEYKSTRQVTLSGSSKKEANKIKLTANAVKVLEKREQRTLMYVCA